MTGKKKEASLQVGMSESENEWTRENWRKITEENERIEEEGGCDKENLMKKDNEKLNKWKENSLGLNMMDNRTEGSRRTKGQTRIKKRINAEKMRVKKLSSISIS